MKLKSIQKAGEITKIDFGSKIRWHAVMPLPLIAASDSFPILPLAIIFVNQRQGQYGTALFSGYHILPQPETMKNR